MNIYVGNLPEDTTESDLREAFAAYGGLSRVAIITDKRTGLPRGFAFVEMVQKEGKLAIAALDGAEFRRQALKVSEARSGADRSGQTLNV